VINRSAIIIQPKEPFYQWLQSIPDPITLSPDDFKDDSAIYLIPSYEDDKELTEIISQMYNVIFEEVLSDWWTVEEDWPQNRTFKMFKGWFDYSAHSMVIDMFDAPLAEE
jgi:hypothetical protein